MKSFQNIKKSLFVLLTAFWSITAFANQEHAQIMVSDVGFATPESVEYYAAEDVYLVTNINGSPFEADDNGDIYVVFFITAKMIKMDDKGHITEMPKPFGARLDGLVKLKEGSIAMSSWESSTIDVYKDGEYETIAEFLNSPADMGVDTKRNRLLIPLFNEDKVLILPL